MYERKEHRKVWQEHFGPIPKDDLGRTYEIHHKNGNHMDNRIENLQCVTIEEHFKIHFEQGDYLAAAAIARRMNLSNADQLARLGGLLARDQKLGFHSLSPEERSRNCSKGGKSHKGKTWFTKDGQNRREFTRPGPGWKEGRQVRGKVGVPKGMKIGVFWNKDGVNKRSNTCPGEGWKRGKICRREL